MANIIELALHLSNKVQERFSKVETQQFQVAECQQKVMELWTGLLWLNFPIRYNAYNITLKKWFTFSIACGILLC